MRRGKQHAAARSATGTPPTAKPQVDSTMRAKDAKLRKHARLHATNQSRGESGDAERGSVYQRSHHLRDEEAEDGEWDSELAKFEASPLFRSLMKSPVITTPATLDKKKENKPTTKQVCTKFREGQIVCDDPHCRKLHIIPRKDCTNACYVKFGICSNWSKCRSRHPWDQKRWGDKEAAYARFKHAQQDAKKFIESKMVTFDK